VPIQIWKQIKLYPTISDIANACSQGGAAGAAVYSKCVPAVHNVL
jgi:hypothetical protein